METNRTRLKYWTAYSLAQTKEGKLFMRLLFELVNQVQYKSQNARGRPVLNISDMLFCCGLKLYTRMPSRTLISQIDFAKKEGYVKKIPHFNTILKYLRDRRLTPVLNELLTLSSLPLKDMETKFAVDATGFSTNEYDRWLTIKQNFRGKSKCVKAHAMCGVFTNIITSLEVTKKHVHESPKFPNLVKRTAKHFTTKEISADKGYLSKKNFKVAHRLGAVPYIPFKSCMSLRLKKGRRRVLWKDMHYMFSYHQEEFMKHYHLRSNIESTFSAIKRKFGARLYTRDFTSQTNEVYLKCICYNITILIKCIFMFNTLVDLNKCARVIPAHKLAI